jgi:hypothetical protein
MRRWFSGDERTLALFLGCGVLTMAFFRLDFLRGQLGITEAPGTVLLVVTAIAWWSLLPRSFVWLDPADLTWRDFGGIDRVTLIRRRLTTGWLVRFLALGYVLALLAALAAAPAVWVAGGAAILVGAGVLALAVVRRPRTTPVTEALVVLAVAVAAPVPLFVLAAAMVVAGVVLVRPGTPPVADVARPALVDGWRERVLRVSGVQFLDLALLLPAARPIRPHPLTGGFRLALLGVAGRVRHVPTAVLLGVAAVAAHRAFPALPEVVVFAVPGYLALLPLIAGLGELWRSSGRRRWVGASDTALRWHHFCVATLLAAVWGVPVWLLGGWGPEVLAAVPVLAACAVRTMTRKAPTYANLVPVDTPMGTVPIRLIMQTLRGPDAGFLAWLFTYGMPPWGVALVVSAVVSLGVFR